MFGYYYVSHNNLNLCLPSRYYIPAVSSVASRLGVFDADGAATDALELAARLQRLPLRAGELLGVLDGGEPEAELVGEVVARAALAVALDERRRAEVLQARAGALQRLPAALPARASVLQTHKIVLDFSILK